MIGLINSAIMLSSAMLSSAMQSRERVVVDPEGYRVANVTGEYLEKWKERAFQAERDLARAHAQCDELAADNIDLQMIVRSLKAELGRLKAAQHG